MSPNKSLFIWFSQKNVKPINYLKQIALVHVYAEFVQSIAPLMIWVNHRPELTLGKWPFDEIITSKITLPWQPQRPSARKHQLWECKENWHSDWTCFQLQRAWSADAGGHHGHVDLQWPGLRLGERWAQHGVHLDAAGELWVLVNKVRPILVLTKSHNGHNKLSLQLR